MKKNKALLIFTILVYIFIFTPLVVIVVTAFGGGDTIAFPPESYSLRWFENILTSRTFTSTFITSLKVAIISTLIALFIGVPAAYALSRRHFKGQGIMKNFFFSPVIVPAIVFGFSLFNFMVIKLRMPIFTSLLIGHTVIILPYIIRVVASSLESFDFAIEEAALSLGASQRTTFFKIVMPNIMSSIVAGSMLAFINSFNNVPVSIFLTGPGVSTLPINMMSYVEYNYDPTVSALSVLLMLMTVGVMFVIERTMGLNQFSK